jgi:hypothetical protein
VEPAGSLIAGGLRVGYCATWHCFTTPTSGSLPNHALLHSPPPVTLRVIQLDPEP